MPKEEVVVLDGLWQFTSEDYMGRGEGERERDQRTYKAGTREKLS